jgi:Bifunctional DNA primase/polymerase, N-terminal
VTLARAALALAAGGWAIFPVQPRGKLPLTEHGFHDATRDLETIRRWWRRWPDANIGVPMGRVAHGGCFVLDVDGPEARARLAELEQEHGRLRPTLTVTTGRFDGGEHRWFTTHATIASTKTRLGCTRLEVKGEGGYVIAPPSVHPTGALYRWATKLPAAEAPAWLVELLTPKPRPARPTLPAAFVAGTCSRYGQAALNHETSDVATTIEGGRNNRLYMAAARLGELVAGGELDENLVRARLHEAAAAAGLGRAEAELTIISGLKRGFLTPRRAPERLSA